MTKQNYSITISAPKEKVWHAMLDDKTYREWTKVFNEGSYYKGNWEKGSTMYFLGPDLKSGDESGMVSCIVENKPYEFLSIEHLGLVMNGVEDTSSAEARKWTPAYENYMFNETDDETTEVVIEMDTQDSMVEEFSRMWPEALKKLKEVAERS